MLCIKNESHCRKSDLHLQALCQRFSLGRLEWKTSWSTRKVAVLQCKAVSRCIASHLFWSLRSHISFRFDISPKENSLDVTLKSDSDSLRFLSKSQMNPWEESFTKRTSEEVKPQEDIKGHYQLRKFISIICLVVVIKLLPHLLQISCCQRISWLLITCVSSQGTSPHWRPNCPDWRPFQWLTLLVTLLEMPSLRRPCSGVYNQP